MLASYQGNRIGTGDDKTKLIKTQLSFGRNQLCFFLLFQMRCVGDIVDIDEDDGER